jgi:arabinan endo-1,5-alpha-L-arabinosidase
MMDLAQQPLAGGLVPKSDPREPGVTGAIATRAGRNCNSWRGQMSDRNITLHPVAGAPHRYAVSIHETGGAVAISVSAKGTARSHVVRTRDHESYRALFTALSGFFGTRVPGAAAEPPSPSREVGAARFRCLLERNIDPAILYGYGDPAVTWMASSPDGRGGCFYLLVTSNDAPDAFPILRSRDLGEWELRGFVFPRDAKPQWAADGWDNSDFWAPELHAIGERVVVCFAARETGGGLAIGLAFADRPEGPYETASEPLLRGGVIDPHLLSDGASTYLYWKEDSNDRWPGLLTAFLRDHPDYIMRTFVDEADRRTASLAVVLWPWVKTLQPMERFLVQQTLIEAVAQDVPRFRGTLRALAESSPPQIGTMLLDILDALRTPIMAQELDCTTRQLKGSPTVVLENDRRWEAHLIEGVWVRKAMGRYFMFYSGNDFSTPDYGIGVAVAEHPLGPFVKQEEPIARSTPGWSGPGHPSVAAGPDGEPVMFLHAFVPGQTGYKAFRALLALPLRLDGERIKLT